MSADYRFGYLLAHTATGIVAREVVETYGREIGRHPVGTGPYMLMSWTPATRAVLDANPDYRGFIWDFAPGDDPRDHEIAAQMRGKRMPQIGHIELSIIEEDTTYWLTFLRGDLDVVNLLPRFQATALVAGKLNPDLAARGLSMYRATPPAAGFTAFNFRDPIVGGFGTARDEDLIWQKSMEQIGLRIRMETLTGAENAKRSTTCTTMLFGWTWFADYPDGENFMQLLYGPNSLESNPGCYQSESYDRLYRQAEALPDGPERNRLFVAMTRQMEADTAWVLGAYPRRIVVVQPWVLGHKAHPFLYSILPFVDLKPR